MKKIRSGEFALEIILHLSSDAWVKEKIKEAIIKWASKKNKRVSESAWETIQIDLRDLRAKIVPKKRYLQGNFIKYGDFRKSEYDDYVRKVFGKFYSCETKVVFLDSFSWNTKIRSPEVLFIVVSQRVNSLGNIPRIQKRLRFKGISLTGLKEIERGEFEAYKRGSLKRIFKYTFENQMPSKDLLIRSGDPYRRDLEVKFQIHSREIVKSTWQKNPTELEKEQESS